MSTTLAYVIAGLALVGSATFFVVSLRRLRTVIRCQAPRPASPPSPLIDLTPVVGMRAVEGPDGHLYVMPAQATLQVDPRLSFRHVPPGRIAEAEAAAFRAQLHAEAQVRARAGVWPRIPWDVTS